MSTQPLLKAILDKLFDGAAVVSTVKAFKALDVGATRGHELINEGYLTRIHIGRSSRITVESILRVLENGVPPKPRKATEPDDDGLGHNGGPPPKKPRIIVKRPT